MITTTRGEMNEDLLRKEIEREDVPCGVCVHTRFFDVSDGAMVREDINVEVDFEKVPDLKSLVNLINSKGNPEQ